MGKLIEMTGERIYGVMVIGRAGYTNNKAILWECRCDCWKTIYETRANLLSGKVKSCGCERKKRAATMNYKHGDRHTRLYRIWLNMKNRCSNQRNPNYDNYGGRGITVCKEWEDDFTKFRDWALNNGYSDNLTVDRINNDEGYRPDNCRWATKKQQCENRRKRRWQKKPKAE